MAAIIQWCNDNQGFLSAILSLVAVLAAIGIPSVVANRQNRIALFEKRSSTYFYVDHMLASWRALCESFISSEDMIGAAKTVSVYVGLNTETIPSNLDCISNELTYALLLHSLFLRNISELEKIPLLFKITEKAKKKNQTLLLCNQAIYLYLGVLGDETKSDFVGLQDNFRSVLLSLEENDGFVYDLKRQIEIGLS